MKSYQDKKESAFAYHKKHLSSEEENIKEV